MLLSLVAFSHFALSLTERQAYSRILSAVATHHPRGTAELVVVYAPAAIALSGSRVAETVVYATNRKKTKSRCFLLQNGVAHRTSSATGFANSDASKTPRFKPFRTRIKPMVALPPRRLTGFFCSVAPGTPCSAVSASDFYVEAV
jgi:hypothetical protein